MTASFLSVALRHAQDQAVDGLKISGQAEGITPPPARTRTLFRREAGRIGGAARKNKPPSPSSCENRSALRREAQQPLLHRRGEQRAVATIDRAAIEAAAAPRHVAVHHINEPVVPPAIVLDQNSLTETGRAATRPRPVK